MISVIIPSYNRASTIERSVRSVLNQTYSDLECIIVDDGSSDNTYDIIKNISDSRVRYYRLEKNSGACAARNKGIDLACGDYIAFQDSDDVWHSDKLQLQLDKMNEFDANICYCRLHRYGFPKGWVEFIPDFETGIITYEELIAKFGISTQTILAKSDICREFLFDVKIKRCQDFDWIVRAGEKNQVVFVREAIVDTYFQENSISNTNYQTQLSTYEYLFEKYKEKVKDYPSFQLLLRQGMGKCKWNLGLNADEDFFCAFKLKRNAKTWLRWFLAKTGILKLIWKR